MQRELNLRIVLENPAIGVAYGLQKGRGNNYETVQTQLARNRNLQFEFRIKVSMAANGRPNFLGPFAQGSAADRFVYLDIGTLAGQKDSCWTRRLKVPLVSINWDLIEAAISSQKYLEARLPGKGGRDGGPSCGTAKDFAGWLLGK